MQSIAKAGGVGQGTSDLAVFGTGALRADLRPDEVLPLVAYLWQLDTRTDPRIPHLLDLVLNAARAGRAPR